MRINPPPKSRAKKNESQSIDAKVEHDLSYLLYTSDYLFVPKLDDSWKLVQSGDAGALNFQLSLQNGMNEVYSPWHSVHLHSSSGHLNCVCTTPRGYQFPLEISMEENESPLRVKRSYHNGEIVKFSSSVKWNVGMFPQTYSEPNSAPDVWGNAYRGDGRPIEVIDIGRVKVNPGDVYAVNPIASFAVINSKTSEISWKVIAIAVDDPLMDTIKDATTFRLKLPSAFEEIRKFIKQELSRGVEDLGLEGRALGREQTICIIADAHSQWQLQYSEKEKTCIQWKAKDSTGDSTEDATEKSAFSDVKEEEDMDIPFSSSDQSESSSELPLEFVVKRALDDEEFSSSLDTSKSNLTRGLHKSASFDGLTFSTVPVFRLGERVHFVSQTTPAAVDPTQNEPKSNSEKRNENPRTTVNPTKDFHSDFHVKPRNYCASRELARLVTQREFCERNAQQNESPQHQLEFVPNARRVPHESDEFSFPVAEIHSYSEPSFDDLYPTATPLPPSLFVPLNEGIATVFERPKELVKRRVSFSEVVEVKIFDAEENTKDKLPLNSPKPPVSLPKSLPKAKASRRIFDGHAESIKDLAFCLANANLSDSDDDTHPQKHRLGKKRPNNVLFGEAIQGLQLNEIEKNNLGLYSRDDSVFSNRYFSRRTPRNEKLRAIEAREDNRVLAFNRSQRVLTNKKPITLKTSNQDLYLDGVYRS